MSEHSLYSPSQLSRIIECPASVSMSEKLPDKSSKYAIDGTKKHEIIAKILRGTLNQKKTGLNAEGREQIRFCLDFVRPLFRDSYYQKIEQKVSLSAFGLPEVYGTADLILLMGREIYVIDWKFGAGIKVYAKDNVQLKAYAAGALAYDNNCISVITCIVQPALDHIDTDSYTQKKLRNWVEKDLAKSIRAAKEVNPKFNAGENQCRWCKANTICKARLNQAQETAQEIFKVYKENKKDEKDKYANKIELAELLRKGKELKNILADIEKYAYEELIQNKEFPFFHLVQGRATRTWENEKNTIAWLEKNTDIDSFYNSKILTPAQVEKLNLKLKKNKEFQELYKKESGKLRLTQLKEGEIPNNPAVEVFKDFK